jgi:hypothetical protein
MVDLRCQRRQLSHSQASQGTSRSRSARDEKSWPRNSYPCLAIVSGASPRAQKAAGFDHTCAANAQRLGQPSRINPHS